MKNKAYSKKNKRYGMRSTAFLEKYKVIDVLIDVIGETNRDEESAQRQCAFGVVMHGARAPFGGIHRFMHRCQHFAPHQAARARSWSTTYRCIDGVRISVR